jgi:hypothetical protein
MAQATQIAGTVTNKTTGKPAAGDPVVLVDVQAGMGEVARTTTDTNGGYALNLPGDGPYLIRVTHQGAAYSIAAPQGGARGDIPVYDVAAKVDGVAIEADVLEVETDNGHLHVTERYFVHNTSSPPRTEWSARTFEVVLPPDAIIAGAAAQRPTSLPTSIELDPSSPKGHYAFNLPLQPDEGDKDTLLQIEYTLPYTSGSYAFHTQVSLPAQSVGVLLPKSMTFRAAAGSVFQSVSEDPTVLTYVARNVAPGKTLAFTISGMGSIPRETSADNEGQAGPATGNRTGGGIGEPINTPDPLSRYKWGILGGLALLLVAAAAFVLRKPSREIAPPNTGVATSPGFSSRTTATASKTVLLRALREELSAQEREKLFGRLKAGKYAEIKAALETVLGRDLNRKKGRRS